MIPSWKKRLLKEQKEADKFFMLLEEYEDTMEDDDEDMGDTPEDAATDDDDTDVDGVPDDVDTDDDNDGIEDDIDSDDDNDGVDDEEDTDSDVGTDEEPEEEGDGIPAGLLKHTMGMLDDYDADDIIRAVLEAKKSKDLESGE